MLRLGATCGNEQQILYEDDNKKSKSRISWRRVLQPALVRVVGG